MESQGLNPDNQPVTINVDWNNNTLTTQYGSKYQYLVEQGKVYYAASQTATTWSVALNTTHTGLVVSNPVTSGKNLVILKVGFALTVAPVAIAHIGLFAGYSSAGIVTHTTPLTPYNAFIGGAVSAVNADAAATLVGTPTWVTPILGGFTAGALPSPALSWIDVDGSIVVKPGGYVGIGALTAAIGFGSIMWAEVDA